MALLSSKVTTFYGIFIGPILLKATERPKQTDWGATTKPSLQWNLPQAMVATCHCLHPNTPYMQQMQMRRTRVWSSLTSVPQYIYLSRTASLSQIATGRPAKHMSKPWKPARLKETKVIKPKALHMWLADVLKWSAWMSVCRGQEGILQMLVADGDGHFSNSSESLIAMMFLCYIVLHKFTEQQ